jgi:hypothetical protein
MNQQKWEFQLVLLYSFVAISLPKLVHETNDWNRTHDVQGFSWRPGSVSFGTFDADGYRRFTVELKDSYAYPATAIRIIKVPFLVEEDGIVVIDPLTQGWHLPIPPGNYALFFTIEPFEAFWKYSLTFIPEQVLPKAEIILADQLLSPPEELLMQADPA